MIVDVHTHVYPRIRSDVLSRRSPEKSTYLPETLISEMDGAGVDRAVILQGPLLGEWNRYVGGAADRYPDRFAAAAFVDPWRDSCREEFTTLMARGEFVAVKLEFSQATGFCGIYPDVRLDSPDIDWLWTSMEALGMALVVDLGAVDSRSYQTNAIRSISGGYSRLKIVIAHLGQLTPEVESDPELMKLWKEQIDLGLLPNVWFDCSAIPAYLPNERFPYPTAQRYVKMAIERVGPAKVMWGTDVPGLLSQASYQQLIDLGLLQTVFLTMEEQSLFLGGNAMNVFGLE